MTIQELTVVQMLWIVVSLLLAALLAYIRPLKQVAMWWKDAVALALLISIVWLTIHFIEVMSQV